MIVHRLALLTAGLTSAAALAGCGQNGPDTSSSAAATGSHAAPTVPTSSSAPTPATPSPAATASVSPTPTARVPAPPALDDAGPVEVRTPATPDDGSAEQAQDRAVAFMRAFARTDLEQQAWWDGVAGFFTPAAAPVYRSTAVENVPVHQVVEGSGRLLPGTTKYRAQVAVQTDIGSYTITMIRADGQWLVDRATPPPS